MVNSDDGHDDLFLACEEFAGERLAIHSPPALFFSFFLSGDQLAH